MIYWNTKKLADAIKMNILSESEKKNYYIGATIITLIFMYIDIIRGMENKYLAIGLGLISLLVLVFGININFKTNGGNSGKDFISRIIILSFPIIIKTYLLAFVLVVILSMLAYMIFGMNEIAYEAIAVIVNILLQITIFWRLNVNLKIINT